MPDRSPRQRIAHTLDLLHALEDSGLSFKHEDKEVFEVEGHRYDLSAADPGQIERIVDEGQMRL